MVFGYNMANIQRKSINDALNSKISGSCNITLNGLQERAIFLTSNCQTLGKSYFRESTGALSGFHFNKYHQNTNVLQDTKKTILQDFTRQVQ